MAKNILICNCRNGSFLKRSRIIIIGCITVMVLFALLIFHIYITTVENSCSCVPNNNKEELPGNKPNIRNFYHVIRKRHSSITEDYFAVSSDETSQKQRDETNKSVKINEEELLKRNYKFLTKMTEHPPVWEYSDDPEDNMLSEYGETTIKAKTTSQQPSETDSMTFQIISDRITDLNEGFTEKEHNSNETEHELWFPPSSEETTGSKILSQLFDSTDHNIFDENITNNTISKLQPSTSDEIISLVTNEPLISKTHKRTIETEGDYILNTHTGNTIANSKDTNTQDNSSRETFNKNVTNANKNIYCIFNELINKDDESQKILHKNITSMNDTVYCIFNDFTTGDNKSEELNKGTTFANKTVFHQTNETSTMSNTSHEGISEDIPFKNKTVFCIIYKIKDGDYISEETHIKSINIANKTFYRLSDEIIALFNSSKETVNKNVTFANKTFYCLIKEFTSGNDTYKEIKSSTYSVYPKQTEVLTDNELIKTGTSSTLNYSYEVTKMSTRMDENETVVPDIIEKSAFNDGSNVTFSSLVLINKTTTATQKPTITKTTNNENITYTRGGKETDSNGTTDETTRKGNFTISIGNYTISAMMIYGDTETNKTTIHSSIENSPSNSKTITDNSSTNSDYANKESSYTVVVHKKETEMYKTTIDKKLSNKSSENTTVNLLEQFSYKDKTNESNITKTPLINEKTGTEIVSRENNTSVEPLVNNNTFKDELLGSTTPEIPFESETSRLIVSIQNHTLSIPHISLISKTGNTITATESIFSSKNENATFKNYISRISQDMLKTVKRRYSTISNYTAKLLLNGSAISITSTISNLTPKEPLINNTYRFTNKFNTTTKKSPINPSDDRQISNSTITNKFVTTNEPERPFETETSRLIVYPIQNYTFSVSHISLISETGSIENKTEILLSSENTNLTSESYISIIPYNSSKIVQKKVSTTSNYTLKPLLNGTETSTTPLFSNFTPENSSNNTNTYRYVNKSNTVTKISKTDEKINTSLVPIWNNTSNQVLIIKNTTVSGYFMSLITEQPFVRGPSGDGNIFTSAESHKNVTPNQNVTVTYNTNGKTLVSKTIKNQMVNFNNTLAASDGNNKYTTNNNIGDENRTTFSGEISVEENTQKKVINTVNYTSKELFVHHITNGTTFLVVSTKSDKTSFNKTSRSSNWSISSTENPNPKTSYDSITTSSVTPNPFNMKTSINYTHNNWNTNISQPFISKTTQKNGTFWFSTSDNPDESAQAKHEKRTSSKTENPSTVKTFTNNTRTKNFTFSEPFTSTVMQKNGTFGSSISDKPFDERTTLFNSNKSSPITMTIISQGTSNEKYTSEEFLLGVVTNNNKFNTQHAKDLSVITEVIHNETINKTDTNETTKNHYSSIEPYHNLSSFEIQFITSSDNALTQNSETRGKIEIIDSTFTGPSVASIKITSSNTTQSSSVIHLHSESPTNLISTNMNNSSSDFYKDNTKHRNISNAPNITEIVPLGGTFRNNIVTITNYNFVSPNESLFTNKFGSILSSSSTDLLQDENTQVTETKTTHGMFDSTESVKNLIEEPTVPTSTIKSCGCGLQSSLESRSQVTSNEASLTSQATRSHVVTADLKWVETLWNRPGGDITPSVDWQKTLWISPVQDITSSSRHKAKSTLKKEKTDFRTITSTKTTPTQRQMISSHHPTTTSAIQTTQTNIPKTTKFKSPPRSTMTTYKVVPSNTAGSNVWESSTEHFTQSNKTTKIKQDTAMNTVDNTDKSTFSKTSQTKTTHKRSESTTKKETDDDDDDDGDKSVISSSNKTSMINSFKTDITSEFEPKAKSTHKKNKTDFQKITSVKTRSTQRLVRSSRHPITTSAMLTAQTNIHKTTQSTSPHRSTTTTTYKVEPSNTAESDAFWKSSPETERNDTKKINLDSRMGVGVNKIEEPSFNKTSHTKITDKRTESTIKKKTSDNETYDDESVATNPRTKKYEITLTKSTQQKRLSSSKKKSMINSFETHTTSEPAIRNKSTRATLNKTKEIRLDIDILSKISQVTTHQMSLSTQRIHTRTAAPNSTTKKIKTDGLGLLSALWHPPSTPSLSTQRQSTRATTCYCEDVTTKDNPIKQKSSIKSKKKVSRFTHSFDEILLEYTTYNQVQEAITFPDNEYKGMNRMIGRKKRFQPENLMNHISHYKGDVPNMNHKQLIAFWIWLFSIIFFNVLFFATMYMGTTTSLHRQLSLKIEILLIEIACIGALIFIGYYWEFL